MQGAIAGTVVVQDAWLSIRGSSCKKTQWTLSECCALCQESPRCNAWSYCNDPNGCGTGCVAGQHEHIAAETPVYTISPMTYTRRLNPEHSCTAAGAWPYGTCSLLYVDAPARPEAPPLIKDAKANVGWVSGIVSKAVSAEVSIAALPDRPGARPAERHADRRRVPAQLQEEEEQQLQDREVDRREVIEEQIRHRWQQRQHRQAEQDRQQAAGSNRPASDSLHKQEPAPKPVEQEKRDDLSQHTPQQMHQHTERPAERLERPSAPDSTHGAKEPQRSSAAEEPKTGAAAPKAAEPKADPAGSLGAAQKPAVVEVPHKGPQHVASLPRAAYDMQPVADDDPDAQKTGGQPQPAKAAAAAVTGRQTQDAALKQDAKPKQEAKPSYDMQPVPDDDPDAPKSSPPQPAPLASAKAVAPAPAPAPAPATGTGKQQPVKPSYEMQPVPDDDPDAPKTGQTPQQPSAAGTSAHGARQAPAPAQQQVQVASTKPETKPEQKPQAQPTAQQHVVSQPKSAAELQHTAAPNTPHMPVAAKEPRVPDMGPEAQHKQQQPQPQPQKPAAAAQPAAVTKIAAESPASKPSQQQDSKPTAQAKQLVSQQPAPAQPKAAAAATVAAIAGPTKAAVQQSTQAADKPTQPQPAPQAPPQQVTPSQPAARNAGELVQEIAALPLTDPQQLAAVEQARLAEQRQEAQRARQQQEPQKAPATAAAKDNSVQQPTAQPSLPAAGPQAADPTTTQAQPQATPAQTVPAAEAPVQAHLFTTTEFPTADADMQPSSDVPEIAPASPSQSLQEPVASELEEKEKELPGQQEGRLSVATNSSNSTVANTSNSSSPTAAVGTADASDTKKPTTTPTGRPIAVEQDQTRTLPPKKAPAAAKRNAAAGMASGSCTAVAVAVGALLLLLWL